jgi:cytochrome c2
MRYLYGILVVSFLFACGEKKAASINIPTNANITNGEKLFKANCITCHLCNTQSVGPSLVGVYSRWQNVSELNAFVQNSATIIERNEYAKNLYEQYNKSVMPAFPLLDSTAITDILVYANSCE